MTLPWGDVPDVILSVTTWKEAMYYGNVSINRASAPAHAAAEGQRLLEGLGFDLGQFDDGVWFEVVATREQLDAADFSLPMWLVGSFWPLEECEVAGLGD